jgi:hypothetical protein
MTGILLAAAAASIMPGVAYAYLDPATGSILVQGLIGAIAAIGVFFGRIRDAVRRLLAGKARGRGTPEG